MFDPNDPNAVNNENERVPEVLELYSYIQEHDLRAEALAILNEKLSSRKRKRNNTLMAESIVHAADVSYAPKSPKEVRLALGMSQAAFAKKMKISQGMVSLIESGKFTPNADFLKRLEKIQA